MHLSNDHERHVPTVFEEVYTRFPQRRSRLQQDLDDHLHHLRMVLNILQHHQFVLNAKKCHFFLISIMYLGHHISAQGVAADPSKIQAMENWPTPSSTHALRGFLGDNRILSSFH